MKTNKTFKWMLMTALVVGFGMTVTSCSSDDDDDNKEGNKQEDVNNDPFGKETEAGIACYNILCQLSAVGDSLPDDWKTHKFTTLEGTVTDKSQPFVRSVVVGDMDEALQYYNDLANRNLTSAVEDNWTMKDVGTLNFTPINQKNCFATIEVNIKQLPDLTQLRLVPASAIPFNAAFEGDPYYRLGDVIRDKEGSYWICVRPCYQPTKVDQSWWVSFNITKNCIKAYTKAGLMKQNNPYNLGNKKLANGYAAQLVAALIRSQEFAQKYGTNTFGEKGKGLAGLPPAAMPSTEIPTIANNWEQKGIWNMIKPSGMSASEFMDYFKTNLTLIYNTAHIQSSVLKIDISQFSTANDFYRTGQKNTDVTLDMQKEAFDLTTYATNGTGNISAIGNKALVIRYKDGKSLSNTSTNLENIDPTKPIEGTTAIYRFDAK